jgi:hypothetical protein
MQADDRFAPRSCRAIGTRGLLVILGLLMLVSACESDVPISRGGEDASLVEWVVEQISAGGLDCRGATEIRTEACLLFRSTLYTWNNRNDDLAVGGLDPLEAVRDPGFLHLYVASDATVVPVLAAAAGYGYLAEATDTFVLPGVDAELCLVVRAGLCGSQTALSQALLGAVGLGSRTVEFYWTDRDGVRGTHIAAEALVGDRWTFIDVTHGAYWVLSPRSPFVLASLSEIAGLANPGDSALWNSALLPYAANLVYEPFAYLQEHAALIVDGDGTVGIAMTELNGSELFGDIPGYVGDNRDDGRRGGVAFELIAEPGTYLVTINTGGAAQSLGTTNSLCINTSCHVFSADAERLEFEVQDPVSMKVEGAGDYAYVVLTSMDWSRQSTPEQ